MARTPGFEPGYFWITTFFLSYHSSLLYAPSPGGHDLYDPAGPVLNAECSMMNPYHPGEKVANHKKWCEPDK